MAQAPQNPTAALWQAEADLLAEGRELLERACQTTRYRHLFPTGPNLALLFHAYQQLDRERSVHRRDPLAPRTRRRERRRLRKLIKRLVREDALARDRRLLWHYPPPRPIELRVAAPELVYQALADVDRDVREDVARTVRGKPRPADEAGASASLATSHARLHRGLAQFREAMINAALAHPRKIAGLHPQYLQFMASPLPTRRRHPIATLLFVKLPLQLMMLLILVFNLAYLGAYYFFNDERLGSFISAKIGGLLDGDLQIESLHWSPMLIVDLLTGRPHPMQARGVTIWEPYKLDGLERTRKTAEAEFIEADLVIHEIIPWNRLGVPKLVEIPWVLHFADIRSQGELWVDVRSYKNPLRDDAWMVSLIDAFKLAKDMAPPQHLKRLSFQIDHTMIEHAVITLDMVERSGWGTRLEFDALEARLDYENWAPDQPDPERIPLRYDVEAKGGGGEFTLLAIHDEPLAIDTLRELELTAGMDYRPLGDLWIAGDADLAGSPCKFEGSLLDVFGNLAFDYRLATTDLGPIGGLLMPTQTDEHGHERPMLIAKGAPASLEITGTSDDIVLEASGQGLTLDLFDEPAWTIYDVDVSLMLSQDPLPEQWRELFPAPPPPTPVPGQPAPPAPAGRWVLSLDTFRGTALDGNIRLHRRGYQDHIVLPSEPVAPATVGEPLLVSIYLDMAGVDLGQVVPEDPELSAMLRGDTEGGLDIHQVVIDDDGLDHVEAELHELAITREHGPDDDSLPKQISADGEVIWDDDDGLDLRGLRLGVDGGQLRLSGGLDREFEQLKPTTATIRVDEGEAFLRAFGLPRWFDELAIEFAVGGPLSNPHGSGTLDVRGAGTGAIAIDDMQDAALQFHEGTLSLRSAKDHDVALFGGHGPLAVDLVLLAKGELLDDPRLKVGLELTEIDRDDLLGSGIDVSGGNVNLIIDDGNEQPVRISALQARGSAYADTLGLAGIDFRDAQASFAFTRDGIEIDQMTLAYHRQVSPALDPEISVPVGKLSAKGRVGFDDDPELALEVEASSLPLSALAASLGQDVPIRGQIARGSKLDVRGSLRRPQVEGKLVLTGLGAAGVPLGSGVLDFSSLDVEASPADPANRRLATASHRQVRIEGEFEGNAGRHAEDGRLDWGIDATVAFGGGPVNAIEASVEVGVHTLPLDDLLTHPSRSQWRDHIVGALHELDVHTRYCPSHGKIEGRHRLTSPPLLAVCAVEDPDDDRRDPLRIDLDLANFWYRAQNDESETSPADPCLDPEATCSTTPLRARLEGSLITLAEPWKLRSGGRDGAELAIEGRFDLASADEPSTIAGEPSGDDPAAAPSEGDARPSEREVATRPRCVPGVPDNATLPEGRSNATIAGELDLVALAPFVQPMGLSSPDGRLAVDLLLSGVVGRPTVTGHIGLAQAIELDLDSLGSEPEPQTAAEKRARRRERPIPIQVAKLDLGMAGGTVYIDGAIEVFDETMRFGTIGTRPTYVDIAGPCSGRFGLAAAGTLDGALVHRLVPTAVEASGGAVELRDVFVAGDLGRFGDDEPSVVATTPSVEPGPPTPAEPSDPPPFDVLRGVISFERKAIRLGVPDIGEVRLTSGEIEFRQCTRARPCGRDSSKLDHGIAIWVGGERGARSQSKPTDALQARVGERGNAQLWGELILDDRFDGLDSAVLTAKLSMFPIALADNSGRTELEAALSSDKLAFETDGENGRITGTVLIERSIWLRDARQGVAVLSFSDPSPAPPSQLSDFLRKLELDLELRTAAPFRVDNNVAKQLEARADLRLGGTIGDPDLSGTIDVERGVVDVDILGGAYDVQSGRVIVNHDIAQSSIELSAARQKQIKINNQLLTLNLHLSGTLDAIQWECTAPGDTSGALATARGCVDYLIFDAGNTDLANSGVRDSRNTNNLLGTRFLPLAGRLTQVQLNEVLEREIPRVEPYLPFVGFRVDQLGVLIEAQTRPEWLRWGWGRLGLNLTYLRGYPGSVIRDSRSVSGRLEILENFYIEATFINRNYTNRVLVLDPARAQSIELRQRHELPSLR
ncbi:translocation/assembly module TamB domain-containing protein [Nannocystaceae bacterium ST9]